MVSKMIWMGSIVLGAVCCLATLAIGGALGYARWQGIKPAVAVHRLSHDLHLCRSMHRTAARGKQVPVCLPPVPAGTEVGSAGGQRRKVIDYIADRVVEVRGLPEVTVW